MIENRMVVLDALRGFAAVAVALVHFTIGMNSSWFQRVCHWGWLGVDVFFVISGFVIPLALARARYCFPSGYLPFLAKRLVRLHPPYLAVVILLIGVSALHTPSTFRGITEIFISHALLLNGFLEKPWLSGIFWSLAIEMQFYLFVGIAAPLLLRNRIQASLMILIFLSIAFLPVPKTFLFPHLPLFCFGILGFSTAESSGTEFFGWVCCFPG